MFANLSSLWEKGYLTTHSLVPCVDLFNEGPYMDVKAANKRQWLGVVGVVGRMAWAVLDG